MRLKQICFQLPVNELADKIAVSLTVGKNISLESANENLKKMDLILAQNEQDHDTLAPQSKLSAETSEKFRSAAVSIVTSMVGRTLNSSTLSGSDSISKSLLLDSRLNHGLIV